VKAGLRQFGDIEEQRADWITNRFTPVTDLGISQDARGLPDQERQMKLATV
jgi:hypothetical protein